MQKEHMYITFYKRQTTVGCQAEKNKQKEWWCEYNHKFACDKQILLFLTVPSSPSESSGCQFASESASSAAHNAYAMNGDTDLDSCKIEK
mgnify:CR=1 FL=1